MKIVVIGIVIGLVLVFLSDFFDNTPKGGLTT